MPTIKSNKQILPKQIAVIGGGASGIFAALAASEPTTTNNVKVTVYEATSQTLQKVKISGGGRCNVLHDTSKSTTTLLEGYPRGKKELQGLFLKYFTPSMARAWFEQRGVALKTEEDGRMFPITDNSQTIIDTLLQAANQQGVSICSNQKVASISLVVPPSPDHQRQEGSFRLELKDGTQHLYHAIILATGSAPSGYALAQQLELPLDPRVPSLFTLNAKTEIKEGGLLFGLSGISVPKARVTLPLSSTSSLSSVPGGEIKAERSNKPKKKNYPKQEGPLLITHHGLSGPAVLRLSAFAAHEFKERNYRGQVLVHWDTTLSDNVDVVLEDLWKCTVSNPKRAVASTCPLPNHSIPRRLWSALVLHSGFEQDTLWGNASKKLVRQLATNLVACSIEITGKGTFKDEFVTAGGVSLKHIDMKKMESKIHPGVFVCGELLNVDGVTGGFNFMNCWSTGYVAGHAAVDHCMSLEYSIASV
jgi:predicted flavoprotein YhiN